LGKKHEPGTAVIVVSRDRATMVRSLIQWTKTLSFPARISPQKHQQHQVMAPQRESSVISSPTVSENVSNGIQIIFLGIPVDRRQPKTLLHLVKAVTNGIQRQLTVFPF